VAAMLLSHPEHRYPGCFFRHEKPWNLWGWQEHTHAIDKRIILLDLLHAVITFQLWRCNYVN